MSSHHFVREDQEPALLILSAEAAPFNIVQELLEWAPTVIVTEQVLPQVLLWGIKLDVVVAGTERIPELKTSLQDQFPLKLLSCHSQEDALSTALYFLIASKQKAVNILSNEPLEVFESFASLDLSVFYLGKRWSFIRSGKFEKWVPAGRTLNVYPTGNESVLTSHEDGVLAIHRERGFWISED
jgi:hypothetical protein